MKKHSARVAPLSACNSPVLTLTKVEGNIWAGWGGLHPGGVAPLTSAQFVGCWRRRKRPCSAAACGGGTWELSGCPELLRGPRCRPGCCSQRSPGSFLHSPQHIWQQ